MRHGLVLLCFYRFQKVQCTFFYKDCQTFFIFLPDTTDQELLNLGSHPDIECLYVSTKRKLPTISLNTVYRTLRLFITLGIVNALNISHEKTKFDANNTPHNHFVCLNCGNIVDFNCREIENIEIPESVKNEGLVGTRYLEFRGICFKCLNKKQNT